MDGGLNDPSISTTAGRAIGAIPPAPPHPVALRVVSCGGHDSESVPGDLNSKATHGDPSTARFFSP
jgi:hypothetical protein